MRHALAVVAVVAILFTINTAQAAAYWSACGTEPGLAIARAVLIGPPEATGCTLGVLR